MPGRSLCNSWLMFNIHVYDSYKKTTMLGGPESLLWIPLMMLLLSIDTSLTTLTNNL